MKEKKPQTIKHLNPHISSTVKLGHCHGTVKPGISLNSRLRRKKNRYTVGELHNLRRSGGSANQLQPLSGLDHLVGHQAISHGVVGNKRGVKLQANTTVRCPEGQALRKPHPHTFGNTKFGAKHRRRSSRFGALGNYRRR